MAKLNNTQRNHLITRIRDITAKATTDSYTRLFGQSKWRHEGLTGEQIFNGIIEGSITFNHADNYRFESMLSIDPTNRDLIEHQNKTKIHEDFVKSLTREADNLIDRVMFMDNTEVLDALAEFESKFN